MIHQWTPGPWKTALSDDTLVQAEDYTEIAHMSGDYDDHRQCHVMEANARLIASAPELFLGGSAQTSIIARAQAILTQYLIPDGIDGPTAIDQLLGLLDGPDQRAAQKLWDTAVETCNGR